MIRAATSEDADEIAALWNWMIRDTLATFTSVEKDVQEIKELISKRENAFFVAQVEQSLLGFMTFGPFRAGVGYASTVEHSVVVSPKAKRQALGCDLMAVGEKQARAGGKHVMVGAISSANPTAVAFHEALGFERVGHLPEVGSKNGIRLDLILMQKIL